MKRQGLLSLTGIALLSLIVLMTLHEWDYATPPPAERRDDTPTLVLEGMHAVRHTDSGALQYRLDADNLTWFEVTNRSTLEGPSVEMFGNNARWLIRAKQGEMRQAEKVIDLRGDVRAERDGPAGLTLQTEHLVYYADKEKLVIPAPSTIRHQGGQTSTGKLEADLRRGVMTLHNGVETRYVPAP